MNDIDDDTEEVPIMSAAAWKDLETWRRLAMKAVKQGKPASFTFTTTAIPAEIYATIAGGLQSAHDSETVANVFAAVERGEQVTKPDEVKSILEAIRLGVEALKAGEQ